MTPSNVHLERDRDSARITGSTENVALLSLDVSDLDNGDTIFIELDESKLEVDAPDEDERILLARDSSGDWSVQAALDPSAKHADRSGPFKDAFRNRMIFVVGTAGTTRETALLHNKARFDAEQWWYRGNGSVEILDDTEFLAHHDWRNGRNIVLYGNAETNAAWESLVDDEVRVDRTGVTIGERRIEGDDLAVLMLRPIAGDSEGTVAIVTGTGNEGTRLVGTMPYWVSGIGYPDLVVIGSDMLEDNPHAVRAAGFFGNDWSVENGEFAFPQEFKQ